MSKSHSKTVDDVDVGKTLGMHGYFFEVKCREIIEKSHPKFQVLVHNYPFKLPNDSESETDIIAFGHNNLSPVISDLFLICECKREEPTMKKWVFTHSGDKYPGTLIKAEKMERKPKQEAITKLVQEKKIFNEMKCANVGYCIYLKKGREHANSGPIYQACSQLIQGFDFFLHCIDGRFNHNGAMPVNFTEINDLLIKGITEDFYVLPVLITTARLYYFETDPKDINSSTGKLNDKGLNEKEVHWLHYRWYSALFTKPQVRSRASNPFKGGKENSYSFDILVVNSKHFKELLNSDLLIKKLPPELSRI